jgi:type IV pilus assembly protein PilA
MRKLIGMFNLKNVVRNTLKDEKGLTLMEVLAVLVILGILSGIAVLNADGLIGGSKEKAHRSNAHMIVDAAKYEMKSERPFDAAPNTTVTYKLSDLLADNYLDEAPQDPTKSGTTYDDDATLVTITQATSSAGAISYVTKITLASSETPTHKYFDLVTENTINTAPIH